MVDSTGPGLKLDRIKSELNFLETVMYEGENTVSSFDDDTSLDSVVPSTSKYLAKEDVDPPLLLTVGGITLDEMEIEGNRERKSVLHFKEPNTKPMVLNNTNKELLKAVTGGRTVGEIRGKQIVVYNDPTVMFGKKAVGGIRIRAPKNQQDTRVDY